MNKKYIEYLTIQNMFKIFDTKNKNKLLEIMCKNIEMKNLSDMTNIHLGENIKYERF